MSEVDCKIERSEGDQAVESLTVGDVFYLRCTGELPVFSEIELQFDLPEEQAYALHLLDSESVSSSQMLLKVTSYRPGQHQLQEAALVSGQERVVLSPMSFEVQSVISPEQPASEPYPSKGPIGMDMPLWFWLAIAGPILLVLVVLLIKVFRSQKRKREVEAIRARVPAVGAYQFFNKRLRALQRDHKFLIKGEPEGEEATKLVSELGILLRDYLEFQFLIPVHGRKEKVVLREIKRRFHSVTKPALSKLGEIFLEVQRASESANTTAQDCRQLVREGRETVTQIYGNLRSTQESA